MIDFAIAGKFVLGNWKKLVEILRTELKFGAFFFLIVALLLTLALLLNNGHVYPEPVIRPDPIVYPDPVIYPDPDPIVYPEPASNLEVDDDSCVNKGPWSWPR